MNISLFQQYIKFRKMKIKQGLGPQLWAQDLERSWSMLISHQHTTQAARTRNPTNLFLLISSLLKIKICKKLKLFMMNMKFECSTKVASSADQESHLLNAVMTQDLQEAVSSIIKLLKMQIAGQRWVAQ